MPIWIIPIHKMDHQGCSSRSQAAQSPTTFKWSDEKMSRLKYQAGSFLILQGIKGRSEQVVALCVNFATCNYRWTDQCTGHYEQKICHTKAGTIYKQNRMEGYFWTILNEHWMPVTKHNPNLNHLWNT